MMFCILDDQCAVYDRHMNMPGHCAGDGKLCQACHFETRALLNRLRYDYIDLSQLLVPRDARAEAGKIFRPKPESKPPMDLHAFALRAEIAWYVHKVALRTREVVGKPWRGMPHPVREGFRLDHDVRWLLERPEVIAALPAAEDIWLPEAQPAPMDGRQLVGGLHLLHKRARRMCGTDPRVITVPGHCPDCETASLRRCTDDAEKVWCLHCKRQFTRDEYTKVVTLQIPQRP